MSKIKKLGVVPKSFPLKVTVKALDGQDSTMRLDAVYRTRTEFGKFVDELFAAAEVQPEGDGDAEVKFSLAQALAKTVDTNADYIMQIATGWDLDEPFTLEKVRQLCDEYPGVAMACIDGYRQAITEGRLGN